MDLIAHTKNMRAVLYLKEKDEEFIKFVLKYNRRRSVALPDFLKIQEEKSLIKIEIPEKAKKFYENLDNAARAIFLSMLYIAPILTTPSCIEDFEKYEILPVMAEKELDIREGLRHLRIAEYSMLDFRLLDGEDIKKYVEKDTKRFWRIKDGKIKVIVYCTIPVPENLEDIVRGYSIVVAIKI